MADGATTYISVGITLQPVLLTVLKDLHYAVVQMLIADQQLARENTATDTSMGRIYGPEFQEDEDRLYVLELRQFNRGLDVDHHISGDHVVDIFGVLLLMTGDILHKRHFDVNLKLEMEQALRTLRDNHTNIKDSLENPHYDTKQLIAIEFGKQFDIFE